MRRVITYEPTAAESVLLALRKAGSVSLDILFALPDFRMRENILRKLMQLKELTSEKMIIQTRLPREKTFSYITSGNLADFYRDELAEREHFNYPPFSILIKITREGAGDIVQKDIEKLKTGIEIGENETVTAEVTKIKNGNNLVKVSIHTGKKRQIKRMFKALGYNVSELDRIQFVDILKDNVKLGYWRDLTEEEVNKLKKLVF